MFGKTAGILVTISICIIMVLGICEVSFVLMNVGGIIGSIFTLFIIHTIVTLIVVFSIIGLIFIYIWVTEIRN